MRPKNKLRFGLMCNSHELMAWQAECLRALLASDAADLKLVIQPSVPLAPARGGMGRSTFDFNGLAFKIYQRLTGNFSRAKRMVNMANDLEKVNHLSCSPVLKGKFSQYFLPKDVETIRRYDLDFILRFGFNIIRGDILESARYGVWSFHHGDETKYRGGPPGFWEIYQGDPRTGTILQRLTDKLDAGIVLYKGFFPTIGYSWPLNCDQVFFGCAEWPVRVCRDILNGCTMGIQGKPSPTNARIYTRPTNWQTARAVTKMCSAYMRHQLSSLIVRERWHVGIIRKPIQEILNCPEPPPIEWLPGMARTRFIADPFAIKKGTDLAILVEDFDQIRRKGCISAICSTDSGRTFSPLVPISGDIFDSLDHKSYPYLFEHDGEVYCVPETSERKEVALYRAVEFPRKWQRICALMDGVAVVDPTILCYAGSWWMFYTDRERGSNVKLYLAMAPRLEGPWTPHPANPIKTDIGGARPAGTPFVHGGVLYRPAQGSTRTYGGDLIIHRVNRLTETQYEEEVARIFTPERNGGYSHGFHTLSSAGDLTVVDGKRYVALPQVIPSMLKDKFRSLLRLNGTG